MENENIKNEISFNNDDSMKQIFPYGSPNMNFKDEHSKMDIFLKQNKLYHRVSLFNKMYVYLFN